MDFIGSNTYYILCGIALVILILALITLHKAKRRPQKSEAESQPPAGTHVPRYAAGDEMDRINRRAQYVQFQKTQPIIPILTALTLVVILIVALSSKINPWISAKTQVTAPTIITNQKLQMELKSADFSSDQSRVYVTCTYTNDTNISFYSIITTIDLKDENGKTIQRKMADTIGRIKPEEAEEITTLIAIDSENIGKVRRVEAYANYEYQP